MFEELKGRAVRSIDEDSYRKFAVMAALVEKDGQLCVLFEERASRLKRQPGEICFPRGARDGQETSRETAVRETCEELCISRDQIQVIAQMDTLYTVYNNEVSVYLGRLTDYQMTFSRSEVGDVFLVPLKFFLETKPEVHQIKILSQTQEDFPYDKIPGGRDYYWRPGYKNVYFYTYGGRTIWGLTAYIMQSIVSILKNETDTGGI